MSPHDQLYMRALRILNDGFKHSAAAIEWAANATHAPAPSTPELDAELARPGFTLRELSLGAGEVASA